MLLVQPPLASFRSRRTVAQSMSLETEAGGPMRHAAPREPGEPPESSKSGGPSPSVSLN